MEVNKNKVFKWTVHILFLMSIIISVISFESIGVLRGHSRVINYVGVMRGATQQLIKQELAHFPSDETIEELDHIIFELKGNSGENNIITINDKNFQEDLSVLESSWKDLKREIYEFRKGANPQELYNLSEHYFMLSNALVFSAQEYSETQMEKVLFFRPWIIVGVSLIILMYIYQLTSILNLQYKNNKLHKIAYIDFETKLPNRTYCSQVISDYEQMELLPDLACIYFDLNNLKKTNDTFGHEAGDKLIRAFARVLRETSKDYGFICRNGGDEFVAFFENCTKQDIDKYLEALHRKITSYNYKKNKVKINFAYGVVFSNEPDVNTINDILNLADKRMYQNKIESKESHDLTIQRQGM